MRGSGSETCWCTRAVETPDGCVGKATGARRVRWFLRRSTETET